MTNKQPEDSDELCLRTAQETAQRVLGLVAVIWKVHEPERSSSWVKEHRLQTYLSAAETKFFDTSEHSENQRIAFSWRAEALMSLIWGLGGLSQMPPLNEQFGIFENEMVLSAINDPQEFLSTAQLRNAEEIKSMEEYLYHQHWRVRDAEMGNVARMLEPLPSDPPIEELDHSIVYERRYGLSWLVGWGDDWDEVPTDT